MCGTVQRQLAIKQCAQTFGITKPNGVSVQPQIECRLCVIEHVAMHCEVSAAGLTSELRLFDSIVCDSDLAIHILDAQWRCWRAISRIFQTDVPAQIWLFH